MISFYLLGMLLKYFIANKIILSLRLQITLLFVIAVSIRFLKKTIIAAVPEKCIHITVSIF